MTPDLNNLKAEFGAAYLRAVAHAAGFFVQESGRMLDADGVDLTIFRRGTHGQIRSPRLEVQLKTTARIPDLDHLTVSLSVKNYDELRATDYQVPRVLVVVVVPAEPSDWLETGEEQMVLRRCGYWHSLRREPEVDNETKVQVKIPRASILDVAQLQDLMQRVSEGRL